MATADDIEAPFIPSDWIGKKRVFTSDLPVAVIAAKNAVYKLKKQISVG
jgi:hypothetical protein